ncbi:MAG: serine hydroxymethyltransferase [Patescibacteria group bacterium]|nr:serine hydroxymethyltransferase [Patescibacteria group bacterium]MDE2438323.1 serine hydroxymethyltransferase [Patescibacteria group bacterium]
MKDRVIGNLIKKETVRQEETLDLIPSENIVSQGVRDALGSVFTNKYAEGYPGRRYYAGNEVVDEVEQLCRERALRAFRLSPKKWHVNVQPYSGSPANLAVYAGLVPLGEKIMGMQLDMGGHLTHGHKVSFTGNAWKQVPYGVNKSTEMLDYAQLANLAIQEQPKLIVAGFTAYPRKIDFGALRKIADTVHAYFMVDMSHFAGLVAGRAIPSPFPYADIVTTTTHKTLRGPRGAMIFCKSDLAKAIDKAVFPGFQGGPHVNQIAGTAVALEEAAQPAFRDYAKQVVQNARVLAKELQYLGWRIVSGGTDTHLLLIDTFARGIPGGEASTLLEKNGIIVNKNTIPFDTRSPMDPSGIRMGTPTLTTRGMKEKEMVRVAHMIHGVIVEHKNVKNEIRALCKKFPVKG